MGHMVHHPLDPDHALRAAEAAEGRLRGLVAFGDATDHADVRHPVGVVDMAHGPGEHGLGQVEAPSAVGGQVRVEGEDPAVLGEADLPRGVEAVAFAGHRDVAGAIEAQPYGSSGQCRTERGQGRVAVRLHLLAAEAAAHAQTLHGHLVGGHTEDVGDDVLRFGRMLGRGLDEDLPVLVDMGEARLRFEVEVFLSGEVEFAF